MFSLISIELKKIFRHKSIYIVFVIVFMFCLLNNLLFKLDYNADGLYKYSGSKKIGNYIKKLEKENKKYDVENESNKSIYITTKTKIEIAKIKQKYSNNDWRYIKANDYLYDDVYNLNYYKYISKNNDDLQKQFLIYDEKIKKIANNDWEYFLRIEKKELEKEKEHINSELVKVNDIEKQKELIGAKKKIDHQLIIVNYRISKKINYSNTYLNRALIDYQKNMDILSVHFNNLSYNDKLEYQERLSDYYVSKYIIEKKININKVNTLNYQIRTTIDDYELFVIIVILITSSIIIGEEFNKGTIKLLLIKPYSRNKVLLSKYISCFLMIIFTVMTIFLFNLLIGGLLLGFGSLKSGIVVYSFNTNKILKLNIFVYMLLRLIVKLPMFIIIETVSFLLGIVLNNTVSSFSITMLIYTFSEFINKLIINYNIKFMRFFITLNWDFKDYLFGGLSQYRYIDIKKSILIFIFYVIIFLVIMFGSFNKKNIKNI